MQHLQPPSRSRFRRGIRKSGPARAPHGFTIIELMVVVLIVAILAALAVPSFRPIVERWRVQQALKGLESSIYYARAEAIKRASTVSIRKNPTGTDGCTLALGNANWDCGWFVFTDINSNGVLDGGEEVLQSFSAPRNIDITSATGAASMRFDRWGRWSPDAAAPVAGFSMVPHGKSLTEVSARGLCMSPGGRLKTIKSEELPCT